MAHRAVNPDRASRILELLGAGLSPTQVANALPCPRADVYRLRSALGIQSPPDRQTVVHSCSCCGAERPRAELILCKPPAAGYVCADGLDCDGRTEYAIQLFLSKVTKRIDGCWEWNGALYPHGYGAFNHESGGYAHRFAYVYIGGHMIPDGLHLDHLCRNRRCVNPAHLEAVTQRENTLRGEAVTAVNARKTQCDHGHEFTPENTYRHDGHRYCRTCRRDRLRALRARREAVAA